MRTALRTTAALATAALALTACGTAAATTSNPGTPPSQSVGTATWPTAASVAAQIGATGVEHSASPGLYASDEATATWHGRDVTITTFASAQLRDNWVKVAAQFTPVLLTGPLYAVTDDGPAS